MGFFTPRGLLHSLGAWHLCSCDVVSLPEPDSEDWFLGLGPIDQVLCGTGRRRFSPLAHFPQYLANRRHFISANEMNERLILHFILSTWCDCLTTLLVSHRDYFSRETLSWTKSLSTCPHLTFQSVLFGKPSDTKMTGT